jgi:hypothetical protein
VGVCITCCAVPGHGRDHPIRRDSADTVVAGVHDEQVAYPVHGRCFVAMAFRDSLLEAYTEGIHAAIKKDCGFEAVRMLELEHNDKICDRIIVEIRKAQFVVADFTFHRGGVYFEAGFAHALGRPVIWTCRADGFDELHFDTRQFNHIAWNTPADLRLKLADRIRGTIPGARLA